jgi:hypothetical protein
VIVRRATGGFAATGVKMRLAAAGGLVVAGVETVATCGGWAGAGVAGVEAIGADAVGLVVAGAEAVDVAFLPPPATSTPPVIPAANAPPVSKTTSHVDSFFIVHPSMVGKDAPGASQPLAIPDRRCYTDLITGEPSLDPTTGLPVVGSRAGCSDSARAHAHNRCSRS